MDTLRQKIIDETLNYERSMNRIIFDRTIEQAKLFNEERAPPSNRDIKFEAQIGKLIEKLKQTIQEGIQAVSYDSHPNADLAQFDRNVRSDGGEERQVKTRRPDPIATQTEAQGVVDDANADEDGESEGEAASAAEDAVDEALTGVTNAATPGASLAAPPE
jgi:hypothetical protein